MTKAQHIRFLRAGGQITQAQWDAFTPTEKTDAAEAGDVVRAEQAVLIAFAVKHLDGHIGVSGTHGIARLIKTARARLR